MITIAMRTVFIIRPHTHTHTHTGRRDECVYGPVHSWCYDVFWWMGS